MKIIRRVQKDNLIGLDDNGNRVENINQHWYSK